MSVQTVAGEEKRLDHPVLPHGHAGLEPVRVRGGDVLTCGFGMTVGAWLMAYVSRMPVVEAPGQVTVGLMVAAVLVGGVVAERYSLKGVFGAVMAGGLSGLLNILILGSVIKDAAQHGVGDGTAPGMGLWVLGSIVFTAVVAGIGGLVGRMFPAKGRREIRWTMWLAVVLMAATLPLITAGGLVTAFRAGLAVPDWPRSYGYNMFLFPLSQMQAQHGNFYEHAHRLMGSLVGLTALALAIYTSVAERRGWVKAVAWGIGVCILIQGIMGGLRVTEKSVGLAVAHGVFAQIVFAGMGAFAAISSRKFVEGAAVTKEGAGTDHAFAGMLVGGLVVQLMLGALTRHSNTPGMAHLTTTMVLLHIIMATLVTLLAMTAGFRAWGLHGEVGTVRKTGLVILGMVLLQLMLGVVALVVRPGPEEVPSIWAALLTTGHQANGAGLLAASVVLWVWGRRLLRAAPMGAGGMANDEARMTKQIGMTNV